MILYFPTGMSLAIKDSLPGDRYTAEFTLGGAGIIVLDEATIKLTGRAKTPGQKAYEASFPPDDVHIAWDYLAVDARMRWERIAEAARS